MEPDQKPATPDGLTADAPRRSVDSRVRRRALAIATAVRSTLTRSDPRWYIIVVQFATHFNLLNFGHLTIRGPIYAIDSFRHRASPARANHESD